MSATAAALVLAVVGPVAAAPSEDSADRTTHGTSNDAAEPRSVGVAHRAPNDATAGQRASPPAGAPDTDTAQAPPNAGPSERGASDASRPSPFLTPHRSRNTGAASLSPPPAATAAEHLDRAQALRTAHQLDQAEAEASAAIAAEPDLGAAYLARAQIRVELADALADDPSTPARRTRATLLRAAASDVDIYVHYAGLPADAAAFFETRRDSLRRQADTLDPQPDPDPPAPGKPGPRPTPTTARTQVDRSAPTPAPVTSAAPPRPQPNAVRRDTSRLALPASTSVVAGAAALTAAGLASASLRIEQTCDPLCTAAWTRRRGLLASSVVLAAVGASAAPIGAHAWASRAATERPGRIAAATLLSLSGVTTAVAIIAGSVATSRWRQASPADDAGLGRIQSLANTAAAFTAPTPTLIGSGIAALLGARAGEKRRRATANRRRRSARR